MAIKKKDCIRIRHFGKLCWVGVEASGEIVMFTEHGIRKAYNLTESQITRIMRECTCL